MIPVWICSSLLAPILWLMILPWFPTSSADSVKLFPCNDASGSAPYQILFLICTWLHSVSSSTLSANSRCFAFVSKYVLLRFFVLVSKNFVESVPVSTLENVRLDRDSCSVVFPNACANTVWFNLHMFRAFGVTHVSRREITRHIARHQWNRSWFWYHQIHRPGIRYWWTISCGSLLSSFRHGTMCALLSISKKETAARNSEKVIMFNTWRRWFLSSRVKLPLNNIASGILIAFWIGYKFMYQFEWFMEWCLLACDVIFVTFSRSWFHSLSCGFTKFPPYKPYSVFRALLALLQFPATTTGLSFSSCTAWPASIWTSNYIFVCFGLLILFIFRINKVNSSHSARVLELCFIVHPFFAFLFSERPYWYWSILLATRDQVS